MKAIEARNISETFDNSLKSMLFSIKCTAKDGRISATWARKDQFIGDNELSALKKLGYKVLLDSADYVTIGW